MRKQKEKALKELEETKAKIGQLESVLALKENEIAQLKVSNSEMTQMALESVSSASAVKTEPGLESESVSNKTKHIYFVLQLYVSLNRFFNFKINLKLFSGEPTEGEA